MAEDFAITEHAVDEERHVLAVRGEIDVSTAPRLKQALEESIDRGRTRIAIDLAETESLDSAALGVLIGAVRRLRPSDGALVLAAINDNVAKTFEITGLDQIFTILPSRQAAIDALDPARGTPG